jgi:hypothetical protein
MANIILNYLTVDIKTRLHISIQYIVCLDLYKNKHIR